MQRREGAPTDAGVAATYGFWICPIRYEPRLTSAKPPSDSPADAVFEAVERLCPRFFRPGEAATLPIPGGALRNYDGSDTKVYVLENGQVLYKFWRSLNPVLIGTTEQVLHQGVSLDCSKIRAPNWRRGGP